MQKMSALTCSIKYTTAFATDDIRASIEAASQGKSANSLQMQKPPPGVCCVPTNEMHKKIRKRSMLSTFKKL
jgi:hypothetical protein